MKKNILLISSITAAVGILAFGCMSFTGPNNQEPVSFMFDLSTRESGTVTKEVLHKAESVGDFMPSTTNWPKHPVQSLKVTIFKGDEEFSETGNGLLLTKEQVDLLHSLESSDIFTLRAQCIGPNPDEPEMTDYKMYYPFTVVPEKQAEYPGGEDALVKFIKEKSLEERTPVTQDDLKRGFVVFTVSKTGEIEGTRHLIGCGYPAIDDKMVDLINSLPETWVPAENSNGENVAQEFVFFFGQLDGC